MSRADQSRVARLPVPVLVLLLLILVPRPAHADPLPRLAVSVPPGGTVSDVLRTIQSVGARDVTIILPPIGARIGGTGESVVGAQSLALPESLPAGVALYRHLTATIGEVPGAAGGREAAIDRSTSEIVAALALDVSPVQGLMLEVTDVGSSPELFSYVMASLIVKARAARGSLHVSLMLPSAVSEQFDDLARRVAP